MGQPGSAKECNLKIAVEDASKKRSMDLRLLDGVAYGHSWFGRWGYRFFRGSFGVTRQNYYEAIEALGTLELEKIVKDFSKTKCHKEYDGRSPLHHAASRRYEYITLLLIQEGVDINIEDNFGNTPLLEAVKNGHHRVASLLVREGASMKIENAGDFYVQQLQGEIRIILKGFYLMMGKYPARWSPDVWK